MSIAIEKRTWFSKRDQYKTRYYVVIHYQDPEAYKRDKEGIYHPKRKTYSCGEVHNPETWVKAQNRLEIIFQRKLRQALDKLEEERSQYIQEEE